MRDILFVRSATTLAELRDVLKELEDFVWLASRCKANDHSTAIVCGDNAGVSIRIVERPLSDGSKVYDLELAGLDTRVPQATMAPAGRKESK